MRFLTIALAIKLTIINYQLAIASATGTISGIIFDKATGEPLIGANVVIVDTKIGSASDLNGEYIISTVPAGEYVIRVLMLGYETAEAKVVITPGLQVKLDFALVPTVLQASDVEISAERIVEGAAVSDIAFTPRMFASKDGLMEDPMKALQTLPGVVSMNDPFAVGQLYIRGGAPEENLFLLDWARVYFPWYMGGVKSIFNSQTIDKIELLTGGFPPKYGNALSSVLSVTTRDGKREDYSGGLSLGVMTTQGLLEGPLGKKASFLLTGGRTYLDLLMGESEDYPVPSFYNGNFKLTYWLSPKHTLAFIGFASAESEDFYNSNPDPGIPTRLKMSMKVNTQTAELTSLISQRLYSKIVFLRSYIDSDVIGGSIYDVDSGVEVVGLREDLTYKPNDTHDLKTGFEINRNNYHIHNWMPMDPGDTYTTYDSTGVPMDFYDSEKAYYTGGVYVQDSYRIIKPLTLTGGWRGDYYFWTGETDLSPRLSARYDISARTALRTAWGIYRMFGDPMFLEENSHLKSQQAIHYILGLEQTFGETYAGWMEVYYKDYDYLIRVDSTGAFNDNGEGYCQGLEFFLQKKLGALTGWATLSLSQAKRQEYFDTQQFYFDYDQPLMSTLVLEYKFTQKKRWFTPDIIGMNFRFASGRPYTPTVSASQDLLTGAWIPVRGETNSRRFADFHALSLRLEWRFKALKSMSGKFYIEGWNLYNRKNPAGVNYRFGSQYPNGVQERFYYATPRLIAGGVGLEF